MKTKRAITLRSKMKPIFYLICTLSIMAISLSCSSDNEEFKISLEGPSLSVSDFTGTWAAFQAVFETFDGSNLRLDVIEEGGSATLAVQANGRFTITINTPDQVSDTYSGKLGFNEQEWGSRLIVVFDGDAMDDYEVYDITLQSGQLSLSGVTTFDFLGNGTQKEAIINLLMERS